MTKAEHLFALLGELDIALVEEAAQPIPTARPKPARTWARWGALCACLLLAVGLWNLTHLRMGSAAPGNAAPPNGAGGGEISGDVPSGESPADPPGAGAEGSDSPNGGVPSEIPGSDGTEAPGSTEPGSAPGDAPSTNSDSPYGMLIAEDTGPMDGQPYQLYYRESDGQWTLTHGEYAIDLTDQMSELSGQDSGELSNFIHLAVNGFLEDEFYPAEHILFENYVLIAFGVNPGQAACLVVGLNDDGSFGVDAALYLSRGE